MDELIKTKKIIIKNAAIINAIGAILIFFIAKNYMPYLKGIVFGFLIAVLCFQQLSIAICKAVNLPQGKAQIFLGIRYLIRLFIYGLVIYISIVADHVNAIGTIFGIMSIKLSVIFSGILKKV